MKIDDTEGDKQCGNIRPSCIKLHLKCPAASRCCTRLRQARQHVWRRAPCPPLRRKALRNRVQPDLLQAPALSVPQPIPFAARCASSLSIAQLAGTPLSDETAVVAEVPVPVLPGPALDVAFVVGCLAHGMLLVATSNLLAS